MTQWKNQQIDDETFHLTDKQEEANCIGPNVELRNCRLILQTTNRALTITTSKLIDCRVEAKRKLPKFNWCWSYLDGCTFHGYFWDCQFGSLPDVYWKEGGLRNCDFTGARLHYCEFFNCDPTTLKFPTWPCFTLLNPKTRKSEILDQTWPPELKTWVHVLVDRPVYVVARVDSAAELSKDLGIPQDDIGKLIERLPNVIM